MIYSLTFETSYSWFWLMIKQAQIFFLLLITNSYVPDDVMKIIEGAKLALFPFDYFKFKKLFIISSFIDRFHFELQDIKFESLGFDSESTIYNICSFFLFILSIIIIHVWLLINNKILQKWSSWGICSCLLKFLLWVSKKLLEILTFSYYIRTALEMSQFIFLTSIYEISKFNHSSEVRFASLIFAITILLVWLTLLVVIFILALRNTITANTG